MTNPTSNFGWQMPEPTDLVTNLPADFEVFGQAVDTDFADLLGGTTGQVLSKTSATDLDFTWVAANPGDITGVTAGTGISGGGTSGTVTVTNDMATTITAAGDIVVGTGSGTYDNLPIGTTNQVLTADTTVSPYKVKWATPAAAGGLSLLSTTTLTGSVSSTISIASGYTNLLILIRNVDGSADLDVTLRLNGDTGNNYAYSTLFVSTSVYAQSGTNVSNPTLFPVGGTAGYQYNGFAQLNIYRYTQTENKIINFIGRGTTSAQGTSVGTISWNNTAAITSIAFTTNAATTFDAGEVYVYGVN